MNGNYHLNRFYAQEKVNARYHEAESHRLARQAREEGNFRPAFAAAASQIASWVGQAAQSLEQLGNARVSPLHR